MTKRKTLTESTEKLVLKHFWRGLLKYKPEMLAAAAHPLGAVLIGVASPFLIGKILASLGTGGDATQYLPALALVSAAGVLMNRIGFTRVMALQAKIMYDFQSEGLRALLRRSIGFHNNRVSGKLVSDALDLPNAFGQFFMALSVQLIPFILVLVVGITVVLLNSLILGTALAAVVLLTIGWAYIYSVQTSKIRKERLRASKAVTSHLSDVIVNSPTVKAFSKEDNELSEHRRLGQELLQLRLRDWQKGAKLGNNRMVALLLFQIGLIILIIELVQRDPALLAVGIFTFAYTLNLINRLFELTNLARQLEEAVLQAIPMVEILHETPEIKDAPNAPELTVTKGLVQFNNVSFHYEESSSNQKIFEHFSLTVPAGGKVGLVGPSGGGKSTLTRLLLRFEDIESGEITIDGQNIAHVTQASLHSGIGYVPQEPLLFHRSVRENIAYGKPEVSDADILEAARKAYALDFIKKLPEGLGTIVGERGVKLSGGQRQRIAIARAILKDAPILLLDEATSALDSESEQLIQKALAELMKGRTTLVIAHRLSTIKHMDQIVVLDNGKILEQGPHEQLLLQGGLYAKLWSHQSGGFIEE